MCSEGQFNLLINRYDIQFLQEAVQVVPDILRAHHTGVVHHLGDQAGLHVLHTEAHHQVVDQAIHQDHLHVHRLPLPLHVLHQAAGGSIVQE